MFVRNEAAANLQSCQHSWEPLHTLHVYVLPLRCTVWVEQVSDLLAVQRCHQALCCADHHEKLG